MGEDLGYGWELTGPLHVELQVAMNGQSSGSWPGLCGGSLPLFLLFLLSASPEHPLLEGKHAVSLIFLSSDPSSFLRTSSFSGPSHTEKWAPPCCLSLPWHREGLFRVLPHGVSEEPFHELCFLRPPDWNCFLVPCDCCLLSWAPFWLHLAWPVPWRYPGRGRLQSLFTSQDRIPQTEQGQRVGWAGCFPKNFLPKLSLSGSWEVPLCLPVGTASRSLQHSHVTGRVGDSSFED